MNRREALRALGAAPVLLGSRCRPAQPALPPGEIVGLSDGFGHRLQGGLRPAPAEESWSKVSVVIVGGGIAGLAAGWRLLRAGFSDFVVLEMESVPGGTARSESSSVSEFPWAAHYIPVPQRENHALIRLLGEMGVLESAPDQGQPVAGEQWLCRDPQERVFFKGQWYEGLYLRAGASPEDLRQLEAFTAEVDRWVNWRDKRGRRAFTLPLSQGSDDPEPLALDRLSMADFLAQMGWTSPRLRWYVEYACRDDYGLTLAETSAWAGLFYFAARVPAPGEEAEPLLTWPEGNGRFVKHFCGALGDRVRLAVAATDVAPTERTPAGGVDVLAFDRRAGRPLGFHARRVIFAAPQFLARYLVRPYRERPPSGIDQFEYGPWLTANLHLRDRPGGQGFPLAWDNVLYESPSLGYVVATHQTGQDHGPTILTYYHAFCDAKAKESRSLLLGGDWAFWADRVLSDLERAHPEIRALTTRLDIMRWGHAMIRPKPGFIWGSARRAAARPHRGIHFAHTDLSGLPLFEEAFDHGLRAAEEVLDALGRPPAERWI